MSINPFVFIFLVFIVLKSGFSQHEIKFKIKGGENSKLYIGQHFGDERILLDTIQINKKGKAVYKGNNELPKGIYMAVVEDNFFFEFLVAEKKSFSLSTNVNDYVYNMKVKGCEENRIFNNYQRFMLSQYKKRQNLENRKKQNQSNTDSLKIIEAELDQIFLENEKGWNSILKNNPKTFFATIIKAMTDPETSDLLQQNKETHEPVFTNHFFDNIDFSESGLLNTPVYFNRLNQYFTQLIPPEADSVIAAGKKLLESLTQFPDFLNYTGSYLLDFRERTGLMTMEKVFIEIASDFYLTGKIKTEAKTLNNIREKIIRNVSNQFGNVSKDLVVETNTGEIVSLHQIPAEYTVIIFYEPDCGYCKVEIPKLLKLYNKYKTKGVEVFAFNINKDKDIWASYIEENNLNWINVWDPNNESNYVFLYNLDISPTIYLLNEKKEIVGKKVNTGFLEKFFNDVY